MDNSKDQDREKGAVEQDERTQAGNTSMNGQLGHRDQDPMLKAADTDFPGTGREPGALRRSRSGRRRRLTILYELTNEKALQAEGFFV